MRRHRTKKRTERNPQLLSAQLGSVLLYGTFGLLMFGPLAFGAVEPWSIFVVEAGAVLLSALWLVKQWLDGEINLLGNPLFLPMAFFAGLIALQDAFTAARRALTSIGWLATAFRRLHGAALCANLL